MELKSGYKQTEVGVIPEEWDSIRLANLVEFTNGKPHEGHIDPYGPYSLITLDSIGIDGKLKTEHMSTDPSESWITLLQKTTSLSS